MTIATEKFIRKPLYVNAVRVTEKNFDTVLVWCEGTTETEAAGLREGKKFIKVNVHGVPKSQRQTKAFVGDWLLHTERGFKVYTDNAFRASFNSVETGPKTVTPALVQDNVEVTLEREPKPAIEVVPAISQPTTSISANGQPSQPMVSDSDSAPPPQTTHGRRIITRKEALQMDQVEIEALLRSGEAVLEQDMV